MNYGMCSRLQSLLLQNAAPVQQSAPESTGSLIGSKFPTNLQQPLQQQGTQDYLTVDQTVQLHTQIQQVWLYVCGCTLVYYYIIINIAIKTAMLILPRVCSTAIWQ